jgi:RHS repeat-associated protein
MTNFRSLLKGDAPGFVNDPECECKQSIYWANQNGNQCYQYNIMRCWSLAETPKQALAYIRGYHPDYPSAPLRVNLGSIKFVTDNNGAPYQFFFNTPFSRRGLAKTSTKRSFGLARPSAAALAVRYGENLENQYVDNVRSFNSRFRFNGKEWDEETGNYYYGARYYDPKVSVPALSLVEGWLSVDPLAHKYPHVSPYNFVENNPLMLVDPTGMGPEDPEKTTSTKTVETKIEGQYTPNYDGDTKLPTGKDKLVEQRSIHSKEVDDEGYATYTNTLETTTAIIDEDGKTSVSQETTTQVAVYGPNGELIKMTNPTTKMTSGCGTDKFKGIVEAFSETKAKYRRRPMVLFDEKLQQDMLGTASGVAGTASLILKKALKPKHPMLKALDMIGYAGFATFWAAKGLGGMNFDTYNYTWDYSFSRDAN